MNKLQYNQAGGVPIYADDLQWQIDDIVDNLSRVARSLRPELNAFKLYGIKESAGNITAGMLYYAGEVYYHAAQAMPTYDPATQTLVIEVVTEDDNTSSAEFADGIVRPTRQLRYCHTVAVSTINPSKQVLFNSETAEDTGVKRLPLWDTGTNEPSTQSHTTGLMYRVDPQGYMHIWGNANHLLGEFRAYYIPPHLRPESGITNDDLFPKRLFLGEDYSAASIILTSISTDGVIMKDGGTPFVPPNTTTKYFLDSSLTWKIAGY